MQLLNLFSGISSFGKQFWGILAYSTMWLLIGTDKENENLGELLGEKLKVSYRILRADELRKVVCHVRMHKNFLWQ